SIHKWCNLSLLTIIVFTSASNPTRTFYFSSFFFYCPLHLRDLHSFPTRRSSDLLQLLPGDPQPDRRFLPVERLLPAHLRRDKKPDRKSTRLNSSHSQISYAVFCLKKKKKKIKHQHREQEQHKSNVTALEPLVILV